MKVLYQDASLLVVYKEAGLKVYRDAKDEPDSLTDHVQNELTHGQPVFPVHRLDSPTCGLVVFAKNPNIANLLQNKFKEGAIEKIYLAIVHGKMETMKGRISRPLKHPKTKVIQKAITDFLVLEHFQHGQETYSLLKVSPLTGRFHQIRKHLDGEGFPIVGDPAYGKKKSTGENPFGRMTLCAVTVAFSHPVTKKALRLTELPTGEFGKWAKRSYKASPK